MIAPAALLILGGISDLQTHLLTGSQRSYLVRDPGATASIDGVATQSLDRTIQSRQVIRSSTTVRIADQLVPANLLHDEETAQLDVTVKRIREKTLWDDLSGWIAPLATGALAVGLALAFPASASLIAGAAAATLAAQALYGWLARHPAIPTRTALLPSAMTGTFVQQVGAQQADRIRAAAAALTGGVDLMGNGGLQDFDRVRSGFVFEDVHQRVPYTFMAVTPLEALPYEGTRIVSSERVVQEPDPQLPPTDGQVPAKVSMAGYRREDFASYLDPARTLTAIQEGRRDLPQLGCTPARTVSLSRAVTIAFRPSGSTALEVAPDARLIRSAGLLTEVYARAHLKTVTTAHEAVLPRPTPYFFPNRIALSTDVLVVRRRRRKVGWPGCACGHVGCWCWTEPYGTVAHRTFSFGVPQQGVYYDSGIDPAGIGAYYQDVGDQPLGAQISYLSRGLASTDVTRVVPGSLIELTRTVWRTRNRVAIVDTLRPTAVYPQPANPGQLPPSWGPGRLVSAGPWQSDPPSSPLPSCAPSPATAFGQAGLRILAMPARGPLAFSSGPQAGTRPVAVARAIEALSRSHEARIAAQEVGTRLDRDERDRPR